MNTSLKTLLLGAGFGCAFLLGQWFQPASAGLGARTLGAQAPGAQTLAAQGRGPVNAPVAPDAPAETQPTSQIVYTEDGGGGGSSSGNGFLAVTGSYGVGTSVLYLIDTVNRQLAVYEARGGSAEQRRIVMVGARRIDLDLQLHGYNDRSEYEYSDLQRLFEKRDGNDRKVRTGLEPSSADK